MLDRIISTIILADIHASTPYEKRGEDLDTGVACTIDNPLQ